MNLLNKNFRWNQECKILKNGSRVIISNDGAWMKLSSECYGIINLAIKNKLSQVDLLETFTDENDRQYFAVLFEKLNAINALEICNVKKQKRKLGVYLVLTNKCNLNCTHCCVSANENETDTLSTSDILSTVNKIIELEPDSITLTGGEPLIRDDIYEILKYIASKYKGTVILMTNGLLINKENILDIIPYVQNIDISIDGVNEETCAMVRGEGVFDKVLKTIELLHEFNFYKISLSMVFGSQNNHLRDDFYKLNEIYGTNAVPRTFASIGRGTNVVEQFIKDTSCNMSCEELGASKDDIRKDLAVGGCGAIEEGFAIGHTGYIYPCSLLMKDKYILGDIRNIENLKDWHDNKKFNKEEYKNFLELVPTNHPKCKDCNINIFCWGCLEVLDRLSDDPKQWERKCKRNKTMLQDIIWS